MKISVLHLTDIHIKKSVSDNPVLKRADKIFEAVRNQLNAGDDTIIVVTGDIAFSGLKEEYDLAFDFFNSLLGKIGKYSGKKPNILFIPGNHDCDFSPNQTVRNLIIEQVKHAWFKNIDESIVELCTEVQKNYLDFVKRFDYSGVKEVFSHSLLNVYDFDRNNKNIIINCFNTSWISKLHEEEGQMAFPTEYFTDDVISMKSNLTINLIHHPINWQNNAHHREFRKLLEETGDLILSGHEHATNQREVSEMGGQTTIYLESAALQEEIATKSSFNLYKFDLDQEEYTYLEYSLEEGVYKNSKQLDKRKYDHRYSLSKKEFMFDKKFMNFLNSTDAQFTHPNTDNLLLEDIYIDVKLREISPDEKDSLPLPKFRSTKDLIFDPSKPLKWSILGTESSGKTALMKILIARFYDHDLIPIFLKGENLSDINVDKLKKHIKEAYCNQYDKKCHSKFDAIDKNKLVLFIDNFQACNVRGRFLIKLLHSLSKISEHQVFSASSMLFFEPIKDEKLKTTVNYFEDFITYQIAELGANLRYELIDRWNKVGKDLTSDEDRNAIFKLNEAYNAQIKTTLGANYIPNHPFYILTLLTSLSAGKNSSDYSVSGYYYESLINNALEEAVTDKDSLQFYNQFLAEFFYFLFENKLKNIARSAFDKFYKSYSEEYTVTEDVEKVLRALVNARIIRINNDFITFSYRYVYYYFVAKLFSTKITDPRFRDQLTKMCKRLYREEFANIIIFLTHLSKDPFIINEIYNNAKELFSSTPITKFQEDIHSINKLVDSIPELVLAEGYVEENRAIKYLSEIEEDELEREFEQKRSNLDYDVNEDITNLDFLNQMIRAIKNYEILGQITKKYWGSIKGAEKYSYAKETFDLALRTLSNYFTFILQHNKDIIQALRYIAKKKNIEDITTMREVANSYVFKLCCMVSQGSVQRVSNAIGHKKLKETFDQIIVNEPNNAYNIIDVAIKMDHTSAFPFEEIETLVNDKEFNKNFLPKYILQSLVYNYLTLYMTDIKEKQKIYDKLSITVKDQRTADLSSQIKKN